MSETITLRGTTFTLAGGFSQLQEDLQEQILAGGGKVQVKLGARVDVVVAGRGAGDTLRHARYQGVPVIDEAALTRLLGGEAIEVVFDQPEVFDESALLSEVRGLLNTSGDARVWPRLVRLLDRCAPSLMEVAVHYASTYLDRIDAQSIGPRLIEHDWHAWHSTPADERLEGTRDWAEKLPSIMRWRPAPLHWIGQLSQGARSPKFQLINALCFDGAKLSAGQVARALSCPDLTGVREISLGYKCRYGKVVFKALCDNPALAQLVSLSLDHDAQGMEHAGLLAEHDALPSLKRMALQGIYHALDDSPLISLGCSPWAERVETLTLQLMHGWYRSPFNTSSGQQQVALNMTPNLKRLLLNIPSPRTYSSAWWTTLTPTLGRAEVFGIHDAPDALIAASALFQTEGRLGELERVKTLDLSHTMLAATRRNARSTPDTAEAAAWRRIADAAMTRYIGRVWLGSLHASAARHFEAAGIEVLTDPSPCLLT